MNLAGVICEMGLVAPTLKQYNDNRKAIIEGSNGKMEEKDLTLFDGLDPDVGTPIGDLSLIKDFDIPHRESSKSKENHKILVQTLTKDEIVQRNKNRNKKSETLLHLQWALEGAEVRQDQEAIKIFKEALDNYNGKRPNEPTVAPHQSPSKRVRTDGEHEGEQDEEQEQAQGSQK